MFFYNNKIVTDQPKTMHDFYMAMPKYVSQGRTNLLDGAEEVVPLALMALGLNPNTTSQSDFNQVKSFLLSIRKGVTTIDSSAYINDAIAGKIILEPGLERRRAPDRAGRARSRATSRRSSRRRRRRSGRTTGASRRTRRIRSPRTPGSTGCSRRARR